LVVLST